MRRGEVTGPGGSKKLRVADIQVAVRPKGEPIRALQEREVSEVIGWWHTGEVQVACVKAPRVMLIAHSELSGVRYEKNRQCTGFKCCMATVATKELRIIQCTQLTCMRSAQLIL